MLDQQIDLALDQYRAQFGTPQADVNSTPQ
jgi:hypothetical protein